MYLGRYLVQFAVCAGLAGLGSGMMIWGKNNFGGNWGELGENTWAYRSCKGNNLTYGAKWADALMRWVTLKYVSRSTLRGVQPVGPSQLNLEGYMEAPQFYLCDNQLNLPSLSCCDKMEGWRSLR